MAVLEVRDLAKQFGGIHAVEGVSFDGYVPDARYPSQRVARDRLRAFAAQIGQHSRAQLLADAA